MPKTTYVTRSFPTDFLREVINTSKESPHHGETYRDQSPEITAEVASLKGAYSVSDEECGVSRWANDYDNVFVLPDGTAWRTSYRRGTGDNGERPYEYDGARDDCYAVEPYEVTVTKYRAIKAEPIATEDASS